MSLADSVAGWITRYSKVVVAVLLLATVAVGAGAPQVERASSLDQFQSESEAAEAMDYVEQNFGGRDANTTALQVVVRDDNVLDEGSLLRQLQFQQAVVEDDRLNATLARRPLGVANLVATAAIRSERAAALRRRAAALQADRRALNRTLAGLLTGLNRTRALQRQYDALNRSLAAGEISEGAYRERAAAIEADLQAAVGTATAPLSTAETRTYRGLVDRIRTLQSRLDALNASLQNGSITQSTYRARATEIRSAVQKVYAGATAILVEEFSQLRDRAAALRADRASLQKRARSRQQPPLAEQIAQIESMNASAIDRTVERVLGTGAGGGGSPAFALMPSGYQPGRTTASATMIVLTQTVEQQTAQSSATERLETTQIAIKQRAEDRFGAADAAVFGAGIISDEISRSMSDSLAIVAPLALLFVLIVLILAYRDLLDILLGLFGIGLVLLWTFGFMGWADIAFNQLFVAVPVLLIGLSIDYAIHVFMRHREERDRERDGTGPAAVRGSMRTALASVGVALVFVTATTAIGFLSNLISTVPPIRQFGVVSSVGIGAALLVFAGLIPALKVELDGLLEGWGLDRRKRAVGTGGRLAGALGVGVTIAGRSPWLLVLLVLVVSSAAAYGGTQVDTSFDQADFLAEDPPAWMDRLPDAVQPGDYDAKAALSYVNENFVRRDTTAQLLVRGGVTSANALERLHDARDRIADSGVAVILPNGEPNVRSPTTAMQAVAARNETFAALLRRSDTDGNGVPDQNLQAVYDAFYRAAPDRATSTIHRVDGEYRALRLEISIKGTASTERVASVMRDVAAAVEGGGLTATATGNPVVFDVVNDNLLQTVIQSLAITLAATFLFLMITYRITDGSALLGLVTLLPVAFSVTWILGTMYLIGIPFNVLTGLITSLTIGLGVAYSIHVSERYAYELDQNGSTWDAMHRTVTGTGGALLGSAATTVGGFGVLVFAILPPLRQFGIITGLTIIYAFLGSVLVLPSLLVLWTRYVGPGIEESAAASDTSEPASGAGDDGDDEASGDVPEEGAPATDAGASDAADGSAGAGTGSAAAAERGADAAPDRDGASKAAGPEQESDDGQQATAVPATDADPTASATRQIEPGFLEPGGEFRVAITVEGDGGRVMLRETVPGSDVRVTAVSPPPTARTQRAQDLFVAWDLDGERAQLEYVAGVPESAAEGAELRFEGELRAGDGERRIDGDATVTVVVDLFERVLAEGDVSERDLQAAAEHLADGRISREQFERISTEWLRQIESADERELPSGRDPTGDEPRADDGRTREDGSGAGDGPDESQSGASDGPDESQSG
ncbi:MAG: MMPL family transporter, partial [Halobacteriaceae archaeon]